MNAQLDKPGMRTPSGRGPKLSRAEVIDAVARIVARRGPAGMQWSAIAHEAGNPGVEEASRWFPDMPSLVDECYSRTAEGLEQSLLRGETAPGTALEKLAAFLVAALEVRRERGSFLSFRRGDDMPAATRRRLRECDMMIRTRLKRILIKGQHDGSLALRNPDSACELILACLQAPSVTEGGAQQQMWDGELVELLLAALSEPHTPITTTRRDIPTATGACLCGTVRYEFDGPFEVMAHCHCSMCRKQHGTASATFAAAPMGSFRWLAGESAIVTYQSTMGGRRCFCGKCGSAVPVVENDQSLVLCPTGGLDGDLAIKLQGTNAGLKAAWDSIADHMHRYDET